jgi:serine/threonine-protein kinase RsbW
MTGTTLAPEVRLTMPARAEGVGVVRQALAGMADALAYDAAVVADMKMAVTEACTNVVVHAYDGEEGTLEVEMLADETALTIVVRDWGTGIQPRPVRREAPALGLGLPLIAALSDSFELKGSTNAGAEVRMTFVADRSADPASTNPVTGTVGPDGHWDAEADKDEGEDDEAGAAG